MLHMAAFLGGLFIGWLAWGVRVVTSFREGLGILFLAFCYICLLILAYQNFCRQRDEKNKKDREDLLWRQDMYRELDEREKREKELLLMLGDMRQKLDEGEKLE